MFLLHYIETLQKLLTLGRNVSYVLCPPKLVTIYLQSKRLQASRLSSLFDGIDYAYFLFSSET